MSLLAESSDIQQTETGSEAVASDTQTEAAAWYWDSGIPGTGARPDYLPEKYNSVAEAAKARGELEARLGLAPKEYDLSKADWLDAGHESMRKMTEYAKTKHVPQDVLDNVLGAVGNYIESQKPNADLEKQKLGEKGQERLDLLRNWAKANLSDNAYKTMTDKNNGLFATADAILALEEMRSKILSQDTVIGNGNGDTTNAEYTQADYQKELTENIKKYKEDPKYRAEMRRKLDRIEAGKESKR